MNEDLIKQIKGELAFLNSQAIKHLVHEADFGACHDDYPSIENRKKKLKKMLNKPYPKCKMSRKYKKS